jgi:chemotaxis protein methyltransferase CheR
MQVQITDEDVELLIADVLENYGYNFIDYSRTSFIRRLSRLIMVDRFASFAELRYRLKTDPDYLSRFIDMVSVNVTEMFRDPAFYRRLVADVLPVLATYPMIRIWHAGCASGEEVYSFAIILKEAGLLHKTVIYATDINPVALDNARSGIYPLGQMQRYSENYIAAGGRASFSDYYTAQYDKARINADLSTKIVFATHNLSTDSSFNEFQLILCRNVLIYFNQELQHKVFTLFDQSLERLGFIGLGTKESLRFAPIAKNYQQVDTKEKIWRKLKKSN